MPASRRHLSVLVLLFLLAFALVAEGCFPSYRSSSRRSSGDDDDAASNDDDAAGDDDDDAAGDDDDDDDDDTLPEGDDDDATPPHGDDDDAAGDDDDDAAGDDDDDDDVPLTEPPPFVDDCTEGLNDEIGDVSGLEAIDGQTYSAQMCANEVDYYVTFVPPETYLSVEIQIDGAGSGSTDLDLYEVDDTGNNGIQVSWSEQDYERLAVYNPTSSELVYYWAVLPYNTASADYDIEIGVSDYHEGMNCDSFYSDTSESGPCNEILQFPRNHDDDQGYFVEHQAHYSNIRREVAYLVAWATEETAAEFSGTTPLSLMDMSEFDGETPGQMVNSLRHPEGTHIEGNDMDIAYYQTDGENNGQTVCPDDGYFCTSPPNILDAERSAFFMAQLFSSPYIRVIGVDTMIADDLFAAADDLVSSGQITSTQRNYFDWYMAYGDGWPFHQHHLHFSWDWEGGWYFMGAPPEGCQLEAGIPDNNYAVGKAPAFPLL